MSIKTVLFDVGGPIDTEETRERLIDIHISAAAREAGLTVSDDEYAQANDWAVASFAPNAYQAIIWHLTGGRVPLARKIHDAFLARAGERGIIEIRPGIAGILDRLQRQNVRLGLAANQPVSIIGALDQSGIGHYFQHREVSGVHGLYKPDIRLFLRACDDLAVLPSECVMVGDRIDNDVVPAGSIGMRTVLFRTGRHAGQQPRSWKEIPDREVDTVEGLGEALADLVGVQ